MVASKLYGLVLAGGKSSRMKKDKAFLDYHGRPQVEYAYHLLSVFCEETFVSAQKEQGLDKKFPVIYDAKGFLNIGPLGGILSAMSKFPDKGWLVLACDLPFVTSATIQHLLRYRDPRKVATAYRSRFNDLPEPLCAVYEPRALKNHLKFFKKDICCPRKILINSDVRLLKLKKKIALDNVNTVEEYKAAVKALKK